MLTRTFLGSHRVHWLVLSMSGSVSNFDITGTMWIVSIIYVLGMKSMWHHWMWGVMLGAFFMAYMGKWVRRSNVLTAAEWMTTRFGDGLAGRLARATYALMAVSADGQCRWLCLSRHWKVCRSLHSTRRTVVEHAIRVQLRRLYLATKQTSWRSPSSASRHSMFSWVGS